MSSKTPTQETHERASLRHATAVTNLWSALRDETRAAEEWAEAVGTWGGESMAAAAKQATFDGMRARVAELMEEQRSTADALSASMLAVQREALDVERAPGSVS